MQLVLMEVGNRHCRSLKIPGMKKTHEARDCLSADLKTFEKNKN